MKEQQLRLLIEKADELKVVDFLEEVINFVREIKPMLNTINSSIAENLMKIPSASRKLAQVTEATESATNEIMNTIDGIFQKTSEIRQELTSNSTEKATDKSQSIIDGIDNDANSIMMALQVQDITSQQIAAVHNVMEKIRLKLSLLLEGFEIDGLRSLIEEYREEKGISSSMMHREIAFDPNAVDAIYSKETRQDDVDDLIMRIEAGEQISMSEDKVDNDEIDMLMASLGANNNETDEIIAAFSDNDSEEEEFSQDDIDALFNNN